jgi:hypothetical protein
MNTCSLCGYEFEHGASSSCASCPLGASCNTMCCPNCGYKFVTGSKTVDFVKKLFTRSR